MESGKGFFIARKLVIDKGDATKLPELIAAKQAALAGKKPEGLDWGTAGLIVGAPTPTLLVLSHWNDAEHLKAFHETEGYKKQLELIEQWSSQKPQDFKIQLLTEAKQPKSGHVLEIYSYVVSNAQRDELRKEFSSEVLPEVLKAKGFVNLGYGVARTESEDETKVVAAIEWETLEAHTAHHDCENFKGILAKFTPKVKDVKTYAINVL